MIKKIREPKPGPVGIPSLLMVARVQVVLPGAAHARERLASHRVHASRQALRPAVGWQRRAVRAAYRDPERLTVIPPAIQPQPAEKIPRRPERAPHIPAIVNKADGTVPQPLSSSRHLVIKEIGQDDRVQHQPSTWGSPTISTSTSPSRT